MATKPSSTPAIWASNALYTTGPFIGSSSKVVPAPAVAAEGHRPGAAFPTPAEYENSQQNLITTWIKNWLSLGSSAGAADAHVVETNSAGRATLHGLTVNDLVNEVAAAVTGVGVATPALLVTNISGGGGVVSQINNTNGAAFATSIGTGSGIGLYAGMTGTVAGGAGVRVDATNTTTAAAVIVNHAGSGTGVEVTATGAGRGVTVVGGTGDEALVVVGGAGQGAITATSGSNGPGAVVAVGAGTAYGVDAYGGNGSGSADGVRGTAVNAGAAGVHGRSASSAGNGAGVQGDGLGDGQIGIFGTATGGYAFLFQGDSTPPLYAIGRFVPQNVDPTASTSTGDFTISLQNQFRYCVAGYGYKPFMSMPTNGSAVIGINNVAWGAAVIVVNSLSPNWDNVVSVTCSAAQGNGFASQAAGNTVKVRFTCEIRTTSAAINRANIRFVDLTSGGAFATWTGSGGGATDGFTLPVATVEWQRVIVAEANRSPGVDGDLTIQVQAQATSGTAMQIRNARIEIIGSY